MMPKPSRKPEFANLPSFDALSTMKLSEASLSLCHACQQRAGPAEWLWQPPVAMTHTIGVAKVLIVLTGVIYSPTDTGG